MKRLPLFFIGVLFVMLLAITACTSAGVSTNAEPNAVSATTSGESNLPPSNSQDAIGSVDTDVTEAAIGAVSDEALSSRYGGLGGGGGYYYGEGGPLASAELSVTGTLPNVSTANVYRLPDPNLPGGNRQLTLDTARLFGVEGPLYYEWYSGLPEDGADGEQPLTYHIFEGQEHIVSYAGGEVLYENRAAILDQYNLAPLPFAERARIAEQFVQDKGLLDGAYDIVQGWGHEVQFRSQRDGVILTWPSVIIQVMPNGEVGTVNIRPFGEAETTEEVALRSAESALEYLDTHMREGQLWYNIIANNPDYYRQVYPQGSKYHWEQTPQATGSESTITTWIQVYRAADGSQPPRIATDRNIILTGDNAMLEAIAAATVNGGNLQLTGTISGDPGAETMAVTAWEQATTPSDLYLNGMYRVADGQAWLELPGGFRIKINNAPEDLAVDSPISVYSYGVRTAEDGCGAVLDWIYIDLMSEPSVEEQPFEDPYMGITGITIDKIELAYHYLYPGEYMPSTFAQYSAAQNAHLVPIWRFAGQTNKGDLVEIYIPALASVELPE